MPKSRAPDFSARPAATGYLYQCRYALLAALNVADQSGLEVSIEKIDDVSFERGGEPVTLIQTKHHLRRQGDLGDSSCDLWKTLRIWSEWVRKNPESPFRTRFHLVSTATAQAHSATALLRTSDRDVQKC